MSIIFSDSFDYAMGTGVLAIAAAKLGAKEIIAIDNDSLQDQIEMILEQT